MTSAHPLHSGNNLLPRAPFPPHPHADMEIVTYVRQGAITHKDSLGNAGRTAAGDVQVMSAGSDTRDGAAITGETTLHVTALADAEVVLVDAA